MTILVKMLFFYSSIQLLCAMNQDTTGLAEAAMRGGLIRSSIVGERIDIRMAIPTGLQRRDSRRDSRPRSTTLLHSTSRSSSSSSNNAPLVIAAAVTTVRKNPFKGLSLASLVSAFPKVNAGADSAEFSPVLAALTVVSAAVVGELVLRVRISLPLISTWLKGYPAASAYVPLVGSAIVCALYAVCKDLGQGPETIYAPLSGAVRPYAGATSDVNNSFSLRRQVVRLLGVVVTLTSGCATAFTGPAAEVGMTVGRAVGLKCLNTEAARRRLVLACAGAGMTANFDTPLAGVFFAADISQGLIKDTSGGSSAAKKADITVLLLASAVSSFICRRGFVGKGHPALNSVSFALGRSPLELGAFALLGAAGALVNVYFERGRRTFTDALSGIPLQVRPLIGGLACTIAAMLGYSQSVFSGFEAVKNIALGHKSLSEPLSLAAFLLSRGFFMALCGATGLLGGPFAHAQFMGAALGALVAAVVTPLLASVSSTSTYVALGLAAVVAAMFRSPLTACVLVLEFTRQFDLLLPLLVTTGTAAVVSHRLS